MLLASLCGVASDSEHGHSLNKPGGHSGGDAMLAVFQTGVGRRLKRGQE